MVATMKASRESTFLQGRKIDQWALFSLKAIDTKREIAYCGETATLQANLQTEPIAMVA